MDQVTALQAIGVPVTTINSNTSIAERRLITEDLLSGHPRTRLLYVTPELCQTQSFRRNLMIAHSQGELTRIAIDEAHCISEWGHDFRPAYKELSWFRRTLKNPPVPISAFTATATPRVRNDVINLLDLDIYQLKVFNTPSARPNIHYEIRYLQDSPYPEKSQLDDITAWLKSIQARREARRGPESAPLPPVSGIIYVPFRSDAERFANALSASGNGIHAVAYHAGLSNEDRSRIQAMWTSPQPYYAEPSNRSNGPPAFSLIVATNAFGMGIDNPHVRFVIHWTPPRSFEGFVQESGRAGRDGRAAASIVYYSPLKRDLVLDRLHRDEDRANVNAAEKTRRLPPPPPTSTTGNSSSTVTPLTAEQKNVFTRTLSFGKVINYCESTTRCRHVLISELFADIEHERTGSRTIPNSDHLPLTADKNALCDFACDFCKEGEEALTSRKSMMAPEPIPELWDADIVEA